ncbi:TonB-dependent receptor [Methylomonas methanica]|uniref:TonB-dependent siderophore receptor n=1 Tax=Methylomonas methanica (strain DSM 25384 / MC09) TaxID=857087 RepID=G0A6E0_METMM|nr:TonB-dependent siderophore receptor [Methylomonas methanica]AEG01768.1 TonB-dependent siderophore receptor [Methylomonas methanica MC09]
MRNHYYRPHALALSLSAVFSGIVFANDTDIELEPVVVKATRSSDAVRGSGGSATKLDVPLRDVPQAVQVVTKELIREQGALEMKDVLRNVSGVAPAQGEGRRDQFYIRGFDASRDMLVDGMRDDSPYFRDLGNVERVEVLKGPAAVLYGRGSAGGIINRITKKPVAKPLREIALNGGSYDQHRVDFDLGDALGSQAAFRVTGAYEAGNNFRDIVDSERFVLAPSISWSFGADTSFLLQADFLHQNRTPDRGIPSVNGRPADVPIQNFYGERSDFATTDAGSARLTAEHTVNDKLTLRNKFQFSAVDLNAANTRTLSLINNNTQVRRQITYFPQDQINYLNQTEAVYKLDSSILQHTLLGGVEFGYQTRKLLAAGKITSTISLQDPQHLLAEPDFASLPAFIDNDFSARTVGAYVQDLVALGRHWKGLVGVRFDNFEQQQDNHLTGLSQSRNDSVWSPRGGIVYQPNDEHALYANISRSFQPVGNDFFFNGSDLAKIKPLESLQYEVGIKSEWLNGQLVSTLALFDITQRNVVTKDPNDPAGLRTVQTGEQESSGVEVDLSGTLLPGWDVFGSYAFTDARITQSNNFAVGNRPGNIPKHAASLWSTYALGYGFSIGGGAFYVGDRYALEDNTVQLPSYVRFDAMLAYRYKNWKLGLNVNNLGDHTYYESANNNNQIQPGTPRTFLFTVRADF